MTRSICDDVTNHVSTFDWTDLVNYLETHLRRHFQDPPFHLRVQIAGRILQVIKTGVGRRSWLSHLWYSRVRPGGGDSTAGEETLLCELLHHTRPGIELIIEDWSGQVSSVTDNQIQHSVQCRSTNIISGTSSPHPLPYSLLIMEIQSNIFKLFKFWVLM